MASFLSVLARDDTLLGACHALGEDFGVSPTWLRALFALGLFLSPPAAAAAYAGCLALVAVSRWLVPDPAPIAADPVGAGEEERQAPERAVLAEAA